MPENQALTDMHARRQILACIRGAAWMLDADGSVFAANASGLQALGIDGDVSGAPKFSSDIGERAEELPQIRIPLEADTTLVVAASATCGPLVERLRQAEAKLQLALDAAQAGVWEMQLATQETVLDAGARALFGVHEESGKISVWSLASRIHTADAYSAWQPISECLESKTFSFEMDFRMSDATGKAVWMRNRGQLAKAAPGADPRLFILSRNAECCHEVERLRRAFQIWPDPVLVFEGGVTVRVNPAAIALFAANTEGELIGKEATDLIAAVDRDFARSIAQELLQPSAGPKEGCIRIQRFDGVELELEFVAFGFSTPWLPALYVIFRQPHEAVEWSSLTIACGDESQANATPQPMGAPET